MNVSPKYSASFEKRAFDVAVSTLLLPAKKTGEIALSRLLAKSKGEELDPIILQKRMGFKHVPFDIQKYLTLDPETGEPFRELGNLSAIAS